LPKIVALSHRPPWWVFLFFFILPFLAFPEIIGGGQTLYRTDISWIHYPGHIFVAEEWLAGRAPLWDPHRQAGVPMLAEPQIGVLYPLRALFLSQLSPSLELSLFILLHFSLAALFTYFLVRSLALDQMAAAVAGLVFGLGGFLMAQTSNVNILTGAAWLPLVLYGVVQTTSQRSWLVALLAGLALAMQILTAHSQIVFYTLVVIGGYGLTRLLGDFFFSRDSRQKNIRYALYTLLLVSLTVISGLLLAAPQLLPSQELLQFTTRAQNRGLGLLTENSLHPAMWLNLLLPSAFGNNVVRFRVGDPFQEVYLYAGFIPLVLTGLSLVWLRQAGFETRLHLIYFWLLLLGVILLAMGRFTPLYEYVIQYLPGFDLFRIPSRWLMVVNLALAILAGFGLEHLLHHGLSRRMVWVIYLLCGSLAAGLLLTWLFKANLLLIGNSLDESTQKLMAAFLNNSFNINPIYQAYLFPRRLPGLTTPALLLGFNLAITLILFGLWARQRIKSSTFAGLIMAAIALDLTLAGGTTINPVKPAERWQHLSGGAGYVLAHLNGERVLSLGASSEDGAVKNLGQYFPSAYRVLSAGGYASPLRLARYETFLDEAHPVQALQILGVRYLLSRGQMGADVAATYPLVFQDTESYVYENKNPLPRAFMVHRVRLAASPDEALAYLKGLEFEPRQAVILEPGPGAPPPPLSGSDRANSTAAIVNQTPELVEIKTRSTVDGYLVLLDTFYPGWVATVDEQGTPIYRANYLVRAVYVPAGEHLVRFEYRPWSFSLGVWLAGLMALLLIAVAVKALLNLR
jgi:hypothetical protein